MEYILIGKILKPFGVRGEVKVYCYTDFPEERFIKEQELLLSLNDNNINLIILSARAIGHNCWAIKFNNIFDMDAAEKLRDYNLYLAADKIPPLAKGQYYFRDLKNCEIYLHQQKVGTVIAVEEGIQCNYLRVVNLQNQKKLIPFLPAFIKCVDLNKKQIEIIEWQGLL